MRWFLNLQGYLFSKPLPVEQMSALLKSESLKAR
jgi:EAL domain-containing protein (putative c-di-GMP-specific phosphodiesterase class I)